MVQLIDLSQEIYQGMEVYPGHQKTIIWQHASHEETAARFEGGMSYQSNAILMCDHGPTHVDSVSHFDPAPEAAPIDQMALDTFYGPAVCIDISHKGVHEYISGEELQEACDAAGVNVLPGDILLMRTGTHDKYAGTPAYSNQHPGLDDSAAEWLAEKRVKAFGVDCPTPDNPISKTYPVHMMCRRTGITHYENLTNLDKVVGKRFIFAGFPLRIRDGTGSPVRAVAILE
ncbi:MAG: cyclase family protein [Ardenticatenaceae bacterium]|nr:cyclase family protein [Ardenticatenaceae bacterium]